MNIEAIAHELSSLNDILSFADERGIDTKETKSIRKRQQTLYSKIERFERRSKRLVDYEFVKSPCHITV